MRSGSRCLISTAVIGAVALLIGPSPAEATLQLRLVATSGTSSNTMTFTSADGSEVSPNPLSHGAYSISAGSTTFYITSLQATSNSPGEGPTGDLANAQLYTTFSQVTTRGGGGTLQIEVTDNGFTTPAPNPYSTLTSLIAANSNSTTASSGVTFSYQSYGDASDSNPFASPVTTPLGVTTSQGPYSSLPASGSIAQTSFPYGPGPFTLLGIITINLPNTGTASFNATTTVTTPEPATLAMAMAGLPVVGLIRWRQGRRRARVIS